MKYVHQVAGKATRARPPIPSVEQAPVQRPAAGVGGPDNVDPDDVRHLCGNVAHKLNNLLSIMLGETDLALMAGVDNPRLKDSLTAIRQAGGQAAALTSQLLAFSKRQLFQPTVFDLNEAVAAEAAAAPFLTNDNIAIVTQASAVDACVSADRTQMAQVIHTLVANAREAMPTGGTLTLGTTNLTVDESYMKTRPEVPAGRYVELTIGDTGTGMTFAVKAHIFEPFNTTKALGKRTGLGLATCVEIVRQSGGHIEVDSDVGVGTVFKVLLPQVPAGSRSAEVRNAPPTGTESILLTDEDDSVRQVAARILQKLGYLVLQASSGGDALRTLTASEVHVDLLLTDVVLPHMGGRELAERARAARPGIRVLFTAGYTNDVRLQEQLIANDVALVRKPFTVESLGRSVRDVLDAPAPVSGHSPALSA